MIKNCVKILIGLMLLLTMGVSAYASPPTKEAVPHAITIPSSSTLSSDFMIGKIYGGIGHFHVDIFAGKEVNNLTWTIALENISGIILTNHGASGFIEHIGAEQTAVVTIPVFGFSSGLKIHAQGTTRQGMSAERTPNPSFMVLFCFALGIDIPG